MADDYEVLLKMLMDTSPQYSPEESAALADAGMKNEWMDLLAKRLRDAQADQNTPMPKATMVRGMPIPDPGAAINAGITQFQGAQKAKALEGQQDARLNQYAGAADMMFQKDQGAKGYLQAILGALRGARSQSPGIDPALIPPKEF